VRETDQLKRRAKTTHVVSVLRRKDASLIQLAIGLELLFLFIIVVEMQHAPSWGLGLAVLAVLYK